MDRSDLDDAIQHADVTNGAHDVVLDHGVIELGRQSSKEA